MINKCRNQMWVGLALIIYWCTFLTKADSYIAPYILTGILAAYFYAKRVRAADSVNTEKTKKIALNIIAAVLSCAALFANYRMFPDFFVKSVIWQTYVESLLVFAGGFIVFREILNGVARIDVIKADAPLKRRRQKIFVFAAMWGALVLVYALILFGARYPGILSPDSIDEMTQIYERSYSNHHPYYFTQIIHVCIAVGLRLFGEINKAVAFYSVFSIFVMASCFIYVVETAYECTKSLKFSLVLYVCYLLMPYHILYSITMWKDVFFAAAVTFFVVSCYRYMKMIGNAKINFIVSLLAAMGMCLLRSNGWLACFISVIAFAALFGKKQKKLIIGFTVVLLSAYVLKHPVLELLHVSQPDTAEFLSIPEQQIARVIADGGALSDEEKQILGKVIDIEKIPDKYKWYISDPIKKLIREKGNQTYITKHMGDFVKLYLQMGIEAPSKYIKAWIDQTKGYWNGGYAYWIWGNGIYENTFGIRHTVKSHGLNVAFAEYLSLWQNSPFLQLFLCIGIHVWCIVILAYRALAKKSREMLFVTIPFMAIILTLLISTPVYSEFRYAYAIFCGFPFVLAAAFGGRGAQFNICDA